MHDIDRTQMEYEPEADAFETDQFEFTEELTDTEFESPFSEEEEMDLATELLTISSEEELDQFLGNLFKRAWRGIKKVGSVIGRVARPLAGILKPLAKKALPFVGGALGSMIPIPGVGTALGSALGGALSKALEMELEGVSPEDKEFEMARRFVRIAGTAARKAALQPGQEPQIAAKNAVISALKRHVPTLPPVSGTGVSSYGVPGRSGRWIRKGNKIILLGV